MEEVLNDSYKCWLLEETAKTAVGPVVQRGKDLFLKELDKPLSAKVAPRRPVQRRRQRRVVVVTVPGVSWPVGFQAVSQTKQEQGGCKGSDE